jgi:hypothetical protein
MGPLDIYKFCITGSNSLPGARDSSSHSMIEIGWMDSRDKKIPSLMTGYFPISETYFYRGPLMRWEVAVS